VNVILLSKLPCPTKSRAIRTPGSLSKELILSVKGITGNISGDSEPQRLGGVKREA